MANAKLIDRINDAFLDVIERESSNQQREYFKAINKEFINNIDNLDAQKVRQIIRNTESNIDNLILLYALQNAVMLILADRQRAKQNRALVPVLAIMGIYSLTKPERFVKRMVKIVKGKGLNSNEKVYKGIIDDFAQTNAKSLAKARKVAIERTEISIVKSKRNKRMIRDFKRLEQQGKSIKQIQNNLSRKYNNKASIDRVLKTELHAQSELVRREFNTTIGYTHKTWKTQQDRRVRETCFHNQIVNKRVPITSDFRACGMRAQQPGDDRLPANERINCRCYLIYD